MTMTYVGKIRAKDINTGKVKYFDIIGHKQFSYRRSLLEKRFNQNIK